jgi:hypothetical protein
MMTGIGRVADAVGSNLSVERDVTAIHRNIYSDISIVARPPLAIKRKPRSWCPRARYKWKYQLISG